ncbi:conserved hypothetical protein [Oceanicaulis sp. 350]|nr:conserved hypothetical protein [Oceanicaulis sp. 350]
MSAARQPAQHVFRAEDGGGESARRAVDRADDHHAAGLHHLRAIAQEGLRVGHMLDHFEIEHHVKLLRAALFEQLLGGAMTVIDGEAVFLGMHQRGLDVGFRSVHRSHGCAQSGDGFGNQSAATADVEHLEALERLCAVSIEVPAQQLADIGQTRRVEFVQGREFGLRIPPFAGDAGEFLDFFRINRGRGQLGRGFGLGHDGLLRIPAENSRCAFALVSPVLYLLRRNMVSSPAIIEPVAPQSAVLPLIAVCLEDVNGYAPSCAEIWRHLHGEPRAHCALRLDRRRRGAARQTSGRRGVRHGGRNRSLAQRGRSAGRRAGRA